VVLHPQTRLLHCGQVQVPSDQACSHHCVALLHELTPHISSSRADQEGFDLVRAFALEDIALLTSLELDSRLLDLVELVVTGVECIKEAVDVTCRMQRLPGMCAGSCFAGLQYQNQRIETGEKRGQFDGLKSVGGFYREVEDVRSGGVVGLGIEVLRLIRVVLWKSLALVVLKERSELGDSICTYNKIVKFVFTTAPNAVIEIIVLADQAETFVGIVPVHMGVILALRQRKTPVFDVNVFAPLVIARFCEQEIGRNDGDGRSVEIRSDLPTRKRKESRSQIGMRSHNISDFALWNVRATHDQGNIDVLFKTTFFPRLKPVVANMVAVVGGIEDVCVFEKVVIG
jgi:hypothetical protein